MTKHRFITFYEETDKGLQVNRSQHVISVSTNSGYEGLRESLDDYLAGLKMAFYQKNSSDIIAARKLWQKEPFRDQRQDWVRADAYLVDGENVESIATKLELTAQQHTKH